MRADGTSLPVSRNWITFEEIIERDNATPLDITLGILRGELKTLFLVVDKTAQVLPVVAFKKRQVIRWRSSLRAERREREQALKRRLGLPLTS